MSSFTTPLEIKYLDGRDYELLTSFAYHVGDEQSTERIVVPAGAHTDFASIPKLFWNILPPTGPYGKAAVIHDFLYRGGGLVKDPASGEVREYSRAQSDGIFREAMKVLGTPFLERWVMYFGVRAGGFTSYKKRVSK